MAARLPWPSARRDYDAATRAGDCSHGVPGGDVIRPWCGSPACPLCRRHPTRWRTPLDALFSAALHGFVEAPAPPALFDTDGSEH